MSSSTGGMTPDRLALVPGELQVAFRSLAHIEDRGHGQTAGRTCGSDTRSRKQYEQALGARSFSPYKVLRIPYSRDIPPLKVSNR